jgi:hypothetical protein
MVNVSWFYMWYWPGHLKFWHYRHANGFTRIRLTDTRKDAGFEHGEHLYPDIAFLAASASFAAGICTEGVCSEGVCPERQTWCHMTAVSAVPESQSVDVTEVFEV